MAHRYRKRSKHKHSINYIGYLEANELLTGKTDVLVCDGFTGNVTLDVYKRQAICRFKEAGR